MQNALCGKGGVAFDATVLDSPTIASVPGACWLHNTAANQTHLYQCWTLESFRSEALEVEKRQEELKSLHTLQGILLGIGVPCQRAFLVKCIVCKSLWKQSGASWHPPARMSSELANCQTITQAVLQQL